MQRLCRSCTAAFEVSEAQLTFLARVGPKSGDAPTGTATVAIPAPSLCPDCRLMRRMSWRNERQLFSRPCSATGESLISMFPPNTPFPVLKNSVWWSEANDATVFGKDVDFNAGIFEQMRSLRLVVPRLHTFNYAEERMQNSVYTNCAGDLKDCYLIFGSGRDEGCAYSLYINDCEQCYDCFFAIKCNQCYEGVDLDSCHTLFYSRDCKQCYDSLYLDDCRGCSQSICCVGLRQKQLHVLNQPVSKAEYERIRKVVLTGAPEAVDLLARFKALRASLPHKYLHGDNNENSTGDYLWNTKDCTSCFDTYEARDCHYCTWFSAGQDCMDVFAWGEAELCYEISGGGQGMYGCAFTAKSFGCRNSYYLDLCVYCEDCFACVGLNRKKYHILNKPYSESEYRRLLPKVVALMQQHGEWGEFFPTADSPWGYNRTTAADYFPLSQSEAKASGFSWCDFEAPPTKHQKTVAGSALPNSAELLGADILTTAILCEQTQKPFRLIQRELEFYRLHQLPPPRLHPEARYQKRLASRGQRKLFSRACDTCSAPLQSSYPPQASQQVVCEDCYLKALY